MSVDEQLIGIETKLVRAVADLRGALGEVAWAHSDLSSGASKVPIDVPEGRTKDSCYAEIAFRAVLHARLPDIRSKIAEALGFVDELLKTVEPLPPEKPQEKSDG